MPDNKGMRWILPAALIGVTLFGLFLALRPKSQISKKATPLVPTADWRQEYPGYFWRSEKELLFARRNRQQRLTLARLDVATRAVTPLPGLDRYLSAQDPMIENWRLSPDGKWLLTLDRKAQPPRYFASALDGSRRVTWPMRASSRRQNLLNILWMPDSRRWVEFLNTQRGVQPLIHHLDKPDTLHAPVPGPLTWPLTITPSNRVITVEQQMGRQMDIYEYGLDPKAAHTQHFSVSTPPDTDMRETEPSPQGDRLAYLFVSRRRSPMKGFLETYLPFVRTPSHTRFSLWVSRTDGSGMKEIGVEDAESVAGVQWTPDGKRLSFFTRDSLYTLPVP